MTILALWCHPRSVSTAFERIMRERGDLAVFHEPFMYHHYLGGAREPFVGFNPDPNHPRDYAGIRAMILERAKIAPVFFKDMAYYIARDLPADLTFIRATRHAFLIRDPAESILSYHKRDPGFACEEVGIEAQWRLFEALGAAGQAALVIRSDALRADPAAVMARYWTWAGLAPCPNALRWGGGLPDGWGPVATWHQDVQASGSIRPPDTERDPQAELGRLGPPWTDYDAHHRPFYEALIAAAAERSDPPAPPGDHQK